MENENATFFPQNDSPDGFDALTFDLPGQGIPFEGVFHIASEFVTLLR